VSGSAVTRTFIVFLKPGPAWVAGLGSRQQPGWDAHARFMDERHDAHQVLLAGPYADYSRMLVIVACPSEAEAERLFDPDPWMKAGVLEIDRVDPWLAFLAPAEWPHSG
jgi:uncharacterized protein YciI